MKPILIVIADTYVPAWDHHILIDGAKAILAELDAAGYEIVRKAVLGVDVSNVKAISGLDPMLATIK